MEEKKEKQQKTQTKLSQLIQSPTLIKDSKHFSGNIQNTDVFSK